MGQPRIVQPTPRLSVPRDDQDFSLVLGGPLYQLFLRTRLARAPLQLLIRRMLIFALISWLPLLVLAAAGRHLMGGVTVPFLRDPEVHIRFLLALPLLIASEVFVHQRMRAIPPQFVDHGIIAEQDQARFEKLVASAMRLRNSVIAEVILLVLVFTLGYWVWRQSLTLDVPTWYQVNDGAGMRLTSAGWWYAFVSLSIFRFILLRWYYRLFIWYRFLWQVRAMPLHFNLFHPDRAGGLGFLSNSTLAFAPVFMAQTMVVAGSIFNQILYEGERLPSFRMEIAGILVFAVLVVVLPLGFFARQLEEAGRRAKREFGTLASYYVDDFHRKWIEGGVRSEEPLLGTSDIQSLADLANSFAVVNQIRLLPITRETLTRLLILVALPLLPLTLTMIPLDEIIRNLFKLAF
jgi:hypothetical protein